MTNLELSSICRLCVQVFEKEKISPIFNNRSYNDRISLPERIKYCSSVEVFEDDGLPSQICNDCLLKLDTSFVFRNQCVLADITLKHLKDFNFNVNEIPNLSKVDTKNQIIKSGNRDMLLSEICSSPEKFKYGLNSKQNINDFDKSENGRHKRNIDKLKSMSLQERNLLNKKPDEHVENLGTSEDVKEKLFTSSMIIILKKKKPSINKKNLNSEIVRNNGNESNIMKQIELNFEEKLDKELRDQNKSSMIFFNEMKECNNLKNVSSELKIKKMAEDLNKDKVELKSVILKRKRKRKMKKKKASAYKCDHCEKVYPSEGGWRYHVHTMHNENYQPFICDLCGHAFKVKKNLVAHKNSIHFHIKHHLCDICGRGFASKYSLKVHKIWHNDERNFTCDVCGTKFRTRGRLNSHRSIHGGPKKYMCHFCSREFRWKKDFEIHIRTHTGEKPFKCSHCGKAFASSTNRKKHEKNHVKKKETDEMSELYVMTLPNKEKLCLKV